MPSEKVRQWLQKTGFPLEMAAASAFRNAGFDVRQSFTYPDPQSEKGREIDVLARDPDWVGVIEVSFVLECKASPNPWVVLASDDAFSGYNRLFAFAVTSEAARRALSERMPDRLGKLLPYIERPARGGYGFRQTFGTKEGDAAYAAAIAALKACKGVVQDRLAPSVQRLAFAFPVIVVDSPLFECSLAEDGSLELNEAEQSPFLFSAHIPEEVGCCVTVVTRQSLNEFAQWAKQLANAIRDELRNEEEKFLSAV